MADDPVRVRFSTTEQDLFRFNLHHRLHHHPLRWLLWGYYPIFIYGGAAIGHGLAHGYTPSNAMQVLAAVVGAIFAAVLYPLLFLWLVRITAKRYARQNRDALGERTFECSPERVCWTWSSGESTLKWTAFQRIDGTRDFIYFYFGPHRAFIVPRRAFPSPEASAAFLQTARDWHAAANSRGR
jgi:hypothetical protein